MRQFIFLFLFIFSVKVLADGSHESAIIETKDGPKSSHDLIKEVKEGHSKVGSLPAPDVVPSDAVQVAGVPSETNAGRPIVLDKPNIVPTSVPSKSGLPSENIAPANSKAEKIALAPKRARREADKSSESKESEEEKKDGDLIAGKIPTEEIAVAHKKDGEETEIATATKASIIAVSEENKRVKRVPDSSSSESHEIHTGIVSPAVINPGLPALNVAPNPPAGLGGIRKRRDASKSSESDEADKDDKSDAFTTKIPTETAVVAKKEPGEDSIKVGSATKVESIAVTGSPEEKNLPTISARIRRDNSKSSEEEKDSAFTTKIPTESVAVAKKKPGEDKAEVATATKVKNVAVSGDPAEENLPTVSPGRARREADKSSESKESGEKKKDGDLIAAKIPTKEIAVAHKKEEIEIATATKASIIAVSENAEKKESRVRRHSEPNSKSNESGEEESAQSPSSVVINKDQIKEEAAIARMKSGESESEVVAVAKIQHPKESRVRRDEKNAHRPGPNESDMAAGDPVKLEAKPKSRARRYA
uniref:Uncharacterized protein n=1 Tax=Panagrolaimus sp. PS1159 TaxID=55785 RepID=A0AC35FHA5_9BILA